MTEGRRKSWFAVTVFGLALTGLLCAAIWFALRDASTARLEVAEAATRPLAGVAGSDFNTTYSAYSVEAPPVVDAIRGGTLLSATAPATTSTPPLVSSVAGGIATTGSATAELPPPDEDGYIPANFRTLAGFDYGLKALSKDDAATTGGRERTQSIPENVMALDGRKVTVTGFMMPIEFSGGKVRSFLLMKNQLLCCFGIAPRLNDFVAVRVPENKGIPSTQDVPVTAKGVLEVEEVVNNGIPLALYTMRADEVVAHD